MKFTVALAIIAGIIGAILTWLYVGPLSGLGLFIPATFLGAASYFAAGAGTAGLKAAIPANIWGILMATLTLILVAAFAGTSPILIGIIVGIMAAVTILGGLVPLLGFIPGGVIGFAGAASYGLLSKTTSATSLSLPTGLFTVMVISFVVGILYGHVGAILAGKLAPSHASTSA